MITATKIVANSVAVEESDPTHIIGGGASSHNEPTERTGDCFSLTTEGFDCFTVTASEGACYEITYDEGQDQPEFPLHPIELPPEIGTIKGIHIFNFEIFITCVIDSVNHLVELLYTNDVNQGVQVEFIYRKLDIDAYQATFFKTLVGYKTENITTLGCAFKSTAQLYEPVLLSNTGYTSGTENTGTFSAIDDGVFAINQTQTLNVPAGCGASSIDTTWRYIVSDKYGNATQSDIPASSGVVHNGVIKYWLGEVDEVEVAFYTHGGNHYISIGGYFDWQSGYSDTCAYSLRSETVVHTNEDPVYTYNFMFDGTYAGYINDATDLELIIINTETLVVIDTSEITFIDCTIKDGILIYTNGTSELNQRRLSIMEEETLAL